MIPLRRVVCLCVGEESKNLFSSLLTVVYAFTTEKQGMQIISAI